MDFVLCPMEVPDFKPLEHCVEQAEWVAAVEQVTHMLTVPFVITTTTVTTSATVQGG